MTKKKEKKAKVEAKEPKPHTPTLEESIASGVVSVEPLKKDPKPADDKKKAQVKPTNKPKPVAKKQPPKPKEKPAVYTRIDSVCDIVKAKKAKTIVELVEFANGLYVDKGGNQNLVESTTVTRFCLNVLKHFDNIEIPKG
jgi:hypothetical protein